MLGFEETITFLVSFTFVWFEVSQVSTKEFRDYYNANIARTSFRVPGWVFGVVWFALKTMIVLALFFFLRMNSNIRIETFVIWVANEVLRKYWSFFFMDNRQHRFSFVICLLIVATGITLVVLLGIDSYWVSLGLMIPYVLWSSFACILNYQWAFNKPERPPPSTNAHLRRSILR